MLPPSATPPATHPTAPPPAHAYGVSQRDAILGNLALWAALGLGLFVLGLAAGAALDNVNPGNGDGSGEAARTAMSGLPALLVALLPFLAAPLLALGTGAWSGHATRSARSGAVSGLVGALVGPILLTLLAAIGLAIGAAAADVDLARANMPYGLGKAGEWSNGLAYLVTGAGFLTLLASALVGALAGWIAGSVMQGRFAGRATSPRRTHARPPMRI